jgi:hypothetical protein
MNKFAVLAASLVASFALAFAVYSAESNPNKPAFPRTVASFRLTNLTQQIPNTLILNAPRTGLYAVSAYMAMTTPGPSDTVPWILSLNWTDEAGMETAQYSQLDDKSVPPFSYNISPTGFMFLPSPAPIEAIARTPIAYSVNGPANGAGGTYELFMTVQQIQ